jgi:hypothetical protein
MRDRLSLAGIYGVAAFLLGDWSLYLETYNEASGQPNSLGVYWLGFAALIFALAAILHLIKPKLGLIIGIVGCGISCPIVLFAVFRSWRRIIPRNEYEFCVEWSVVIVAVATIVSTVIFKRQMRLGQRLG